MIRSRIRYGRMCGDFWHNEKVCNRSLGAIGLHAKAIAYCADKMTDGKLPKWMISALAVGADVAPLIEELTRVMEGDQRPMWIDRGDYFELVAYSEHNITRAEWAEEKKRIREAVKKSRSRGKRTEVEGDDPEPDTSASNEEDVTRYKNVSNEKEASVSENIDEEDGEKEDGSDGKKDVTRYEESESAEVNAENRADAEGVTSYNDVSNANVSFSRLRTKDEGIKINTSKSAKADVRRVFDHWVATHSSDKGPTPKLDKKREAKIRQRRTEGFTVEQLCQAIDGCKLDSFYLGDNDKGKRYNKLETILRDAGTVEKHIEYLLNHSGPQPSDPLDAEFAALVAEKNSGPSPERLSAIDTRLRELAEIKQRGRQNGAKTQLEVIAGGNQ